MLPVQITVRGMEETAAIESQIRKRTEKLTHIYTRITRCHVIIDISQNHKHQGKLYNVRIDLTVPGKELAVTKKCDEDMYVALRDAFNAVEKQLESYAHKRQGHIKTHNGILHGHIARLLLQEGYGFIDGSDGNEYYFSVTNVAYPHFTHLVIGDAVQYHAVVSQEGWQAQHIIRERSN